MLSAILLAALAASAVVGAIARRALEADPEMRAILGRCHPAD